MDSDKVIISPLPPKSDLIKILNIHCYTAHKKKMYKSVSLLNLYVLYHKNVGRFDFQESYWNVKLLFNGISENYFLPILRLSVENY